MAERRHHASDDDDSGSEIFEDANDLTDSDGSFSSEGEEEQQPEGLIHGGAGSGAEETEAPAEELAEAVVQHIRLEQKATPGQAAAEEGAVEPPVEKGNTAVPSKVVDTSWAAAEDDSDVDVAPAAAPPAGGAAEEESEESGAEKVPEICGPCLQPASREEEDSWRARRGGSGEVRGFNAGRGRSFGYGGRGRWDSRPVGGRSGPVVTTFPGPQRQPYPAAAPRGRGPMPLSIPSGRGGRGRPLQPQQHNSITPLAVYSNHHSSPIAGVHPRYPPVTSPGLMPPLHQTAAAGAAAAALHAVPADEDDDAPPPGFENLREDDAPPPGFEDDPPPGFEHVLSQQNFSGIHPRGSRRGGGRGVGRRGGRHAAKPAAAARGATMYSPAAPPPGFRPSEPSQAHVLPMGEDQSAAALWQIALGGLPAVGGSAPHAPRFTLPK